MTQKQRRAIAENNADKNRKRDRVRRGRCRQCNRPRKDSPSASRCRACLKAAREFQRDYAKEAAKA